MSADGIVIAWQKVWSGIFRFLWTAAATVVCQNSSCPFSKKQIKKATWWFLLLFILSTEESEKSAHEGRENKWTDLHYCTNFELPLQNNSCHTYLLYSRPIYRLDDNKSQQNRL